MVVAGGLRGDRNEESVFNEYSLLVLQNEKTSADGGDHCTTM